MAVIYLGERTNQEPEKETYTSDHKGTAAYLQAVRATIKPGSEETVPDDEIDAVGRYVGPGAP